MITFEDLCVLKEQYLEEERAVKAKIAVVCDLMKLCEEKKPVVEEVCEEAFEVETVETVETESYDEIA